MITIYALCEPTTGAVRYVGQALVLERRVKRHMDIPATTHKGRWIAKLKRAGLQPSVRVLDIVSVEDKDVAEQHYIDLCRRIGCRLTNATNGGTGGLGHQCSEETREKLRRLFREQMRRDPGFRQRGIDARRSNPALNARGVKSGAYTHPERIARGDKHGSHTHPERWNRGESHHWYGKYGADHPLGGDKHWSKTHPERVLRGEHASGTKLTIEQVRAIRERFTPGKKMGTGSRASLAREFGIAPGTVSQIIAGQSWRAIEGLPPTLSYHEEKLGHRHEQVG